MGREWNALLLSGLVSLVPISVNAQTSQNQTQTVCSQNFNDSNGNEMTVEGDCIQNNITYVYNGPVYNNVSERQNILTEADDDIQRPTGVGLIPTESPVYRISETQSEGLLLDGPETKPIIRSPGQVVSY